MAPVHACVQVLLCSVSGDIFPKQATHADAAENAKAVYLAGIMAAVTPWISPAQDAVARAANGDESELLDACR